MRLRRALRLLSVLLLAPALASVAVPVRAEAGERKEEAGDEKVTTASRAEERAFESPRQIEALPLHEDLRPAEPSTPRALENAAGLTFMEITAADGVPQLRGRVGRAVMVLLDGIRLDTAITPLEADPRLGLIDPFSLQRSEILHGAASALYGSGAEGGVIELQRRGAIFNPRRAWDASAELGGIFDSAELGAVANLGLTGHLRGLGAYASGSFRHVGDRHGGRDSGPMDTDFNQANADAGLAWAVSRDTWLRLSYTMARQLDVPRPERSIGSARELEDRSLDLVALRFQGQSERAFARSWDASVHLLHQRESDERRLTGSELYRDSARVASLGLELTLQAELSRNRLSYGLDFESDWVSSSAERQTSSGQLQAEATGRYPDGSRYLRGGLFVADELSLGKLVLDGAARLEMWRADVAAVAALAQGSQHPGSVTGVGSLHGRYLVGNGLSLVAGVSQGYLAPNLDDLAARGCSDRGYLVQSPGLDAEKSVTGEAGIKLDLFGVLGASLFYAYTYLVDPLNLLPATVGNPAASTYPCGDALASPVYRRANADSGSVHSIEGSIRLELARKWQIFTWLAWARGSAGGEPLDRVAPLSGLASVRYAPEGARYFGELRLRWATSQERLSRADRSDPRICPAGPDRCEGQGGFAILSLRGGARLADWVRLTLEVDNLTHQTYRLHGSAIDGPGIGALVGLELLAR